MSSLGSRWAVAAAVALLMAVLLSAAPAFGQPATFDLQAHRGGRGETTEESLRAFAKAIQTGVSTLELDIVVTRDGQPLVWHAPTIQADKCSDTGPAFPGDPGYPYVGKLVHQLTVAQIHTLDCGHRLKEFPDAEVVRGNKIATLPEVFAVADSHRADAIRYNIETKVEPDDTGASAPPQEFVDVILAAVRSADKLARVEIQSFDWRTLPLVRRAEPSIPLVALYDERAAGDPVLGARAAGADIVSPDYRLVTGKPYVDRAHALGLKIIPWTVDDAENMRRQIDYGVDGLITDFPTLARGVLAELGVPLPPAVPG